ncbi:winged helix-turn-helix domain-containing protein [Mesorhizobium xinjiangense]|uniref:winged helix-turn-helix domain-containing protein n=1 Tax=Mesorhizobium xinjiangense TaxID=2678685 RepID=UPI0012ECBC59|nr:winged helix-turn-helix domain-containing protein [Mesorhizobium xinjiangense]
MPSISLRINLDPEGRIGPGKIALLEHIAHHGSISAAGRAMNMSYRRAWNLVEEMNGMFARPLVETRAGGAQGGGTRLTSFGKQVVARFRDIEQAASKAAANDLAALQAALDQS